MVLLTDVYCKYFCHCLWHQIDFPRHYVILSANRQPGIAPSFRMRNVINTFYVSSSLIEWKVNPYFLLALISVTVPEGKRFFCWFPTSFLPEVGWLVGWLESNLLHQCISCACFLLTAPLLIHPLQDGRGHHQSRGPTEEWLGPTFFPSAFYPLLPTTDLHLHRHHHHHLLPLFSGVAWDWVLHLEPHMFVSFGFKSQMQRHVFHFFIMPPPRRRRNIILLPLLLVLLFMTRYYSGGPRYTGSATTSAVARKAAAATTIQGRISVISCGRLGNQLVQYAVLIAAAEKTGYQPVFINVRSVLNIYIQ